MKSNMSIDFYDESKFDGVKYFIKEHLKNLDYLEAILICGSYYEGLADSFSDLDIRVIIKDGEKDQEEYEIDAIRINIIYINLSVIKKNTINIDNYHLRWIMQSLVLYDKNNIITDLRSKISENMIELTTKEISKTANRYRDALGSYEKRDYDAAILSARLAAENAVKALLLSNKRFNLKSRWLFNQLKNVKIPDFDLYMEYLDILGLEKMNENFAKYIILKTTNFLNYVINIQIPNSESFKKIFENSINIEQLFITNQNNKGFTRNPYILWIKYPDNSVLVYSNTGKIFEYKQFKGLIWQLFDGKRTIQEIIEYVHNHKEKNYKLSDKSILRFINHLKKLDLICYS